MGNLGLFYQPYGAPQHDFLKNQVNDGKTNPYTNTMYSGFLEDPFNHKKNEGASQNVKTEGIKRAINETSQFNRSFKKNSIIWWYWFI